MTDESVRTHLNNEHPAWELILEDAAFKMLVETIVAYFNGSGYKARRESVEYEAVGERDRESAENEPQQSGSGDGDETAEIELEGTEDDDDGESEYPSTDEGESLQIEEEVVNESAATESGSKVDESSLIENSKPKQVLATKSAEQTNAIDVEIVGEPSKNIGAVDDTPPVEGTPAEGTLEVEVVGEPSKNIGAFETPHAEGPPEVEIVEEPSKNICVVETPPAEGTPEVEIVGEPSKNIGAVDTPPAKGIPAEDTPEVKIVEVPSKKIVAVEAPSVEDTPAEGTPAEGIPNVWNDIQDLDASFSSAGDLQLLVASDRRSALPKVHKFAMKDTLESLQRAVLHRFFYNGFVDGEPDDEGNIFVGVTYEKVFYQERQNSQNHKQYFVIFRTYLRSAAGITLRQIYNSLSFWQEILATLCTNETGLLLERFLQYFENDFLNSASPADPRYPRRPLQLRRDP
jgi:hypothetical protein